MQRIIVMIVKRIPSRDSRTKVNRRVFIDSIHIVQVDTFRLPIRKRQVVRVVLVNVVTRFAFDATHNDKVLYQAASEFIVRRVDLRQSGSLFVRLIFHDATVQGQSSQST